MSPPDLDRTSGPFRSWRPLDHRREQVLLPVMSRYSRHGDMATERQIAANRANALRSTGPKTDSGKARSSFNALTHGLTARAVVVDGEDPAAFDDLLQKLAEKFNPVGPIEEDLVGRIAMLMWRLRRVPVLEAALFSWVQFAQAEADSVESDGPFSLDPFSTVVMLAPPGADRDQKDDQRALGRALETMLSKMDALNKLNRYEVQLMNQLKRSLEDLRTLQSERAAGPTS